MRTWPAGWGYQADLFDEAQASLFADLEPPVVPHFIMGEDDDEQEDDDGGRPLLESRLGGTDGSSLGG